MATTALEPVRARRFDIHVALSATCVAAAFVAFLPTYWLQMARSTFVGPPLLHLHAALFFSWTLLYFNQARLASSGRLPSHRVWGVAGVALATAMVFVGVAAAMHSLVYGLAAGYGDRSRAFAIVPVSAIGVFAAMFAAAVLNVQRAEWHKRLMLVATAALMQAAFARVFLSLVRGVGPGLRPGIGEPPPVIFALGPGLVADTLILVGLVYDWRTRGRPHSAYLIGGAILLASQLARIPLSATPAWRAVADAMAGFAV